MAEAVTLHLATGQAVSALHDEPEHAFARLVLAHGAGAGMRHAFMEAAAAGLAGRGVAVLRYQFPFMEGPRRPPDRPEVAHAAVRAAVAAACAIAPKLPVFAGGKSFGARMTSQAQAALPLPGVRGLVFFGFPLHPPGRPASSRADHLTEVGLPMCFLQGTRDTLAELGRITAIVDRLGAHLVVLPGADHAFHVPARGGGSDTETLATMLDEAVEWMRRQAAASAAG